MTHRPIIFSGPMVRALLEGRKTQTRRLLKPQPTEHPGFKNKGVNLRFYNKRGNVIGIAGSPDCAGVFTPFGIGDRLYVRENFQYVRLDRGTCLCAYQANCEGDRFTYADDGSVEVIQVRKWRPSIHMPRLASRITLTVTAVKVERLQDISEEDAIAEGIHRQRLADWAVKGQLPQGELIAVDDPASAYMIEPEGEGHEDADAAWDNPRKAFMVLWDSLNAKRAPWDSNPWVVAVSFEVEKINIERLAA